MKHASPTRLLAAVGIMMLLGIIGWTRLSDDALDEPSANATGPSSTVGPETTTVPPPPEVPPDLGPVKELLAISGWLNTDQASFADVRGQVTIVQFWTFGCSNCRATIPHLQELYEARHADGLEIIGVHAHEFDYERDPDNVADAAVDLGVVWPIALDTDKATFRSWQGARRFWPRTYVIDADDRIRFDHIGEGAYEELASVVDQLLAQPS